ncbi:galactose ABC transporter substrate-binding protein [Clostridium sp. SHJSY1]|uniref:galactose ABC transporter substrate-binding protein n=1 Tax=Clostridium sp. SHJSY1 TaxID=2942483 RepID=UPI0028758465|nr:galactose ABC transporter substrate-binding protein [Clostridium sp. SHJSY1]MDS0526684.1 galactose ABC transporter substrate-binding protein [Clostridium sp. SHJSY1]
MKLLKKLIVFTTILCFSTILFLGILKKNIYAFENNETLVNVGVSLIDFNDPYMSLVKKCLENIENANKDKVKFTFFDGKNNQAIQNETINTLLNDKSYNLLLINLVDAKESLMENIINRVKQTNRPVIFFNVLPPFISSSIRNYNKSVIIGTDSKQSGILEGNILIDIWNNDKKAIDKNNNNVMEYIMLRGKEDTESINRTKYSVSTVNDAGIRTKEIASVICDWDEELAKNNVDALFSRYGNNIEAIISNNDSMAIGAIKALQKYGYNTGNNSKNIVVVGVDGIPEAKDLVDKGIMSGTVIQDPTELATALYTVGINLVHDLPALKGTNYKFNGLGNVIELPYYEYIKQK